MALRTWVSGPQREVSGSGSQDLGFRPSTRGFRTWISGPGFQALDARFQDLDLRTWVSEPRKLSILRSSYLFPVTFLCVHRHFSFSRHFSLRPVCLSLSPPSHTGTRRLARPCVVNLGRAGLTLWESGSLDWTHTPRRARSVTDPSSVTHGFVNLYI
jgi:hypothetical protein